MQRGMKRGMKRGIREQAEANSAANSAADTRRSGYLKQMASTRTGFSLQIDATGFHDIMH